MALTLVFVAPLLSAVDAGLDPRSYRQRSAEAATCHEERTEDEGDRWDGEILPTLTDYIRIPAKSPMFDAKWREHGHLDRAVALVRGWSENRPIEGLRVEVMRLEGRTP